MTDFWNAYALAWLLSAFLIGLYWSQLRPRLIVDLRWLAVFIIVIFLCLLFLHGLTTLHPVSNPQAWDLDKENNFPTYVSTALLLSVSAAAFRLTLSPLTDNRERPMWLIGALLYLGFALTDYWEIFRVYFDHYNIIFAFATIIFTLSVFVWQWFTTGETRRSLQWLLFGLLVSAVGAYIFDKLAGFCIAGIVSAPALCFELHISEEILELFGTLFALLGLLKYTHIRNQKTRNSRQFRFYLFFLAILAGIGVRELYFLTPLYEMGMLAEPVTVDFAEGALTLRGYRFPNSSNQPHNTGNFLLIQAFMKANRPITREFGHTFQLIDQASGKTVASIDEWVGHQIIDVRMGRIFSFKQNMENIANVPRNRALWLVLSLWYQDDDGTFHNYTISESDQRLLGEKQAILTEFVLHTETETTNAPALATFAAGLSLREADLPAQARAGAPLSGDFTWSAANDGGEDWTQFLHFVHEESGYFWNHDQPPLGARLPTRFWYAGLTDHETWQFTLPDDIPAGRYQLYTGLYRLSDLARMTVYNEFGDSLPDARLSLGFIQIVPTQEESND